MHLSRVPGHPCVDCMERLNNGLSDECRIGTAQCWLNQGCRKMVLFVPDMTRQQRHGARDPVEVEQISRSVLFALTNQA